MPILGPVTPHALVVNDLLAGNTVSLRGCKVTAGASADPGAATVRADIWKH